MLSNGKNVQPNEIEYKLERYEHIVREAAVMADGDMLRAIIVPQASWAAGRDDREIEQALKIEILGPYNRSVANYKKVMAVTVWHDDLPRTKLEKLQRYKLHDILDRSQENTPHSRAETQDMTAAMPWHDEYLILKRYMEREKHIDVKPSSHIELDLAFDSLDRVSLQGFIEQTFGIEINEPEPNAFSVRGRQRYIAGEKTVEGDWSNAAALEAFNLVGGSVRVTGLDAGSIQGDRVCLEYFEKLKAPGAKLDISNCPDLGPVLFALAAALGQGASFTGTRRLRIKESDRAAVMANQLAAFDIETELYDNEVIIKPGTLKAPAGTLSAHNDHRIVMAQTLLCSITGGVIDGVQAVRKSYPNYFADLGSLGLEAENEA